MQCRRPTPSIVFTAIAATLVLLPWASVGVPDAADHQPASADQTKLVHQPLTDLGAGETIREVSQSTPFSMVALTGNDLTGTSARVRARQQDGSWGQWYEIESPELEGPDGQTTRRGTEPVFVGSTTAVQIAVTRAEAQASVVSPVERGSPADPDSPTNDSRPSLGYVPASVEKPLPQGLDAVLITPQQIPPDSWTIPTAAHVPGGPPIIVSRAQWGADESMRCGAPRYDDGVRAAVVHHTAGSNDYSPHESAEIIRAIYAYHTRELGWCDIAYNALVDKYGQVFEGRAGGITAPVAGAHTGGFNAHTWGVAMLGDFNEVPPTPVQMLTTGRLLGWRLALDRVNPLGTVTLASAGGPTLIARGVLRTLPTVFAHRDVGNTDCPGHAAYAAMDHLRQIAAGFNAPPGPEDLAETLRGGAIHARWESLGGMHSFLGAPRSPEATGAEATRYVPFEHGAIYWSPQTGANPVTGAIYDAWAWLGYERGALGLPTSGEIPEAQWIKQNFQHGTLNFDRETGTVTRVIDAVALPLPPPPVGGPPIQLERFTPIRT